jgi:hypothetical protein
MAFFHRRRISKVSYSQYSQRSLTNAVAPLFSSSVYGDRASGTGMKKDSKAFVTNNGYL